MRPQHVVSRLPLSRLEPITLAATLPGVVAPTGSTIFGPTGIIVGFSVNGQRPRGNNYLLDGTDNNDITFGGNAQPFSIADAVEEVSAQTANFGVEFGRASGVIFNVITKSGTNAYHGALLWQYQSQPSIHAPISTPSMPRRNRSSATMFMALHSAGHCARTRRFSLPRSSRTRFIPRGTTGLSCHSRLGDQTQRIVSV